MEVGEEGDQYFTSSAVHSARHGQVLHFTDGQRTQ